LIETKLEKILVTGASGFIGKSLVDSLKKKGYRVISLIRKPSFNDQGSIVVDLCDREKVNSILQELQPEFIFHLASEKNRTQINSIENLFKDFENSKNLIEASLKNIKLKKFVFLGSVEEYGSGNPPFSEFNKESPISAYSYSKTATVHLLTYLYITFGFPMVVLRPSLVYGPGQGREMFLPDLILTLLQNQKFQMSPGGQTRDFLYVDDLIEAMLLVLSEDKSIGKIINLGLSLSYKIKDIALIIAELIGKNSKENIHFGSLPYRKNEIMDYQVDTNLAFKILNWKPTREIKEGLAMTIDYYKSEIGID
jgi:UDP-glucose 4-epimerase